MVSMRKHRETQMVERRESEEYADGWVEDEVLGCQFEDVRHCKRLRQVLGQFSRRVGAATPWASQDWAGVKAAYRFLSNRRVSETAILAGHFLATRSRVPKDSSPILVLHDTTEFSYKRRHTESVGLLRTTPCWPGKAKRACRACIRSAAFSCIRASL
jgi:hypothetical protein